MRLISHVIKRFDFLGPSMNFTIKEFPNFRSVLGGFFSLLIYFLYILFFVLFGKDMIFKLNPTVASETLFPNEKENYSIDNYTFFAFRFENNFFKPQNLTNKLFPYANYITYDLENSKFLEEIELDIINCNNSQFKKDLNSNNYKAEEWFCIDYKKIYNRTLEDFTNNYTIIKFLNFEIQICEVFNIYTKSNCKDFKKTRELISKEHIMIAFLYSETIFFSQEYDQPLQARIRRKSDNINVNLQISNYASVQKTTVEQDDGFLFSNEREISSMNGIFSIDKFLYYRTDEELNDYYFNNTKYDPYYSLYSVYAYYEENYVKYSRKYMKIQDIFGNVKGFMDFIIFLLYAINIYTNYRFDFYLFNELVNVRVDDKINNNFDIRFINNQGKFDKKKRKIELTNFFYENSNIYINDNKQKNQNEASIEHSYSINNEKILKDKIDVNQLSFENKSSAQIRLVDCEGISSSGNLFVNNNSDQKNTNLKSTIHNVEKESDKNNIELQENNLGIKRALTLELNSKLEAKKRFLKPNFFNYYFECCVKCFNFSNVNIVNKKLSELRLLKRFVEKINKKFDIFNYLKTVREVKNLEEYVFKDNKNLAIFKILAKNFYELRIETEDQMISSERDKNNNEMLNKWIDSQNFSSEDNFSDFVIQKLNC